MIAMTTTITLDAMIGPLIWSEIVPAPLLAAMLDMMGWLYVKCRLE
jgi:hypothetical protein